MGRVHNLDLYACTGRASCVGCVETTAGLSVGEEEATSGSVAPACAERETRVARGAVVGVGAALPLPGPEVRPMLLDARWERDGVATDRAKAGETIGLRARALHVPPGTAAEISVLQEGAARAVRIASRVEGGHVRARWTPSEAGMARFEVIAAGAGTSSPALLVEAERPPLKLRHVGAVLRDLAASSRVIARWWLEDLDYAWLCVLAESAENDADNDPVHMPRALCLLPGMEGDDVREAQEALRALGHACAATGTFDAATKAAMLGWLTGVQPDRETPAPAVRSAAAEGGTLARMCVARRVTDWTDLWFDH